MPREKGFTLIEILVTVIILAVGLLGLAGLQAAALKYTSTAYQRAQATSLAYDILDQMRANVIAARAGAYNMVCPPPPLGATLAARDLQDWCQALVNTLPLATGSVAQNGNRFTITIQWDDDRDPNTPALSFQTDTEL